MPAFVKSLGTDVFRNCEKLDSVMLNKDLQVALRAEFQRNEIKMLDKLLLSCFCSGNNIAYVRWYQDSNF